MAVELIRNTKTVEELHEELAFQTIDLVCADLATALAEYKPEELEKIPAIVDEIYKVFEAPRQEIAATIYISLFVAMRKVLRLMQKGRYGDFPNPIDVGRMYG